MSLLSKRDAAQRPIGRQRQDAHFPVQFLPVFIAFVRAKSGGTDQRIAEYFADLSGFNERVRKIINAVEGR